MPAGDAKILRAAILPALLASGLAAGECRAGDDPLALLDPFGQGDTLPGGWTIDGVQASPDAIAIRLAARPDRREAEILLLRRDEGRPAFSRTPSFNIVLVAHGAEGAETDEDLAVALRALSDAIARNDDGRWRLPESPGYHGRGLASGRRIDGGTTDPAYVPDARAKARTRSVPVDLVALAALLAILAGAGTSRAFRRLFESALGWIDRAAGLYSVPLVSAVLVLALLVRARSLGIPFEADMDAQRIFIAARPIGDILLHDYPDARHPQLYYMLLHFIQAVSISEQAMRLPSLVFSVLAILAAYLIVLRAATPTMALFTAAVLAISPHLVFHARQVSDTMLFTFLVLASVVAYARTVRRPSTPGLVALAVVDVLMIYTYYLGWIVLAAQVLAAALDARVRARPRPYLACLGGAVCAGALSLRDLVLLIASDVQLRQAAEIHPAHVWGSQDRAEILEGIADMILPASLHPVGIIVYVAAIGAAASRPRPAGVQLCLIASATLAASLVLGAPFVRLLPYYALAAFPLLVVAISSGLVRLYRLPVDGEWTGHARRVAVVLAALAVVYGFAADMRIRSREIYGPGEGAIARIADRIVLDGPGRTIVTGFVPQTHLIVYYASSDPLALSRACEVAGSPALICTHGGETVIALTDNARMSPGWEARAARALEEARSKDLWFVMSRLMPSPAVLEILESSCREEMVLDPYVLYACGRAGP